jgi:ABC-type phosphate/phosphonate transport system substrate-binding protein
MRGYVTTLCLLACVTGGARHAWSSDGKIAIAILPCTDVVMTVKKFSPLAAYLENEAAMKIALVVPRSHAELERAVKHGEIDFALQDPHTYISLADLFDPDSLLSALSREGTDTQRGVVIARKDSGIRKLGDLRGKRVMFGRQLSAVKWLAAKALFWEHGLGIYRDLGSYSHGGCCEDIAFSVLLKAVDAGVVCDHFLADHPEKQKELGVDVDALFVVARTEPVPVRVFAARRGMPKDLADAVARALLRLDRNSAAHSKILDRAELGGFRKTTDTNYDGMRAMTAAQ